MTPNKPKVSLSPPSRPPFPPSCLSLPLPSSKICQAIPFHYLADDGKVLPPPRERQGGKPTPSPLPFRSSSFPASFPPPLEVYMRVCLCMWMCTCMCMHACVYARVCVYACVCVCICICVYACVCVIVCKCFYVRIFQCLYAYVYDIHVHTHYVCLCVCGVCVSCVCTIAGIGGDNMTCVIVKLKR